MKFGKLTDIENVDFSLPQDAAFTHKVLENLEARSTPMNIYVGCTGWSMKEWVGKVYPLGTRSTNYLKQYAKQFNTIELNTTHYRIPTSDTITKWYNESTEDFRFCPKIPQSISHRNDLGLNGGQIAFFCESIRGLKEKLGCCFMQLPPYFGVDRIKVLEQFLANFPSDVPLAIELRHESWYNEPQHLEQFLKLVAKYNCSTIITDVAGRRDVLHLGVTTDTAMIRFVGNGLHPTDYSRIDEWIERLANWEQKGLRTVYFFPHEPDNLLAPDLAQYLCGKLAKLDNVSVRGPQLLNNQMSLF